MTTDRDKALRLAEELRRALDDPKRAEWGDGPWEHLGDAERDVRVLLLGMDALAADLEAATLDRSEWREGIVSVYDYEGNYVGCMGSETWQWTLSGGIAKLKADLEAAREALENMQARIHGLDDEAYMIAYRALRSLGERA